MATIEFEAIEKDDIPRSEYGISRRGTSVYEKLVQDFIDSGYESVAITKDKHGEQLDKKSAVTMYSGINGAIKRMDVGKFVKAMKRKETIYLVYVDEGQDE